MVDCFQGGCQVFGRRKKSHGRLLRSELSQALVHLQLAGMHAATGTARSAGAGAARMRGRLNTSLAMLAPVLETAREEARKAAKAAAKQNKSHKSKGNAMSRKWPYVLGVVAAGAAVGASAYVIRKRRAARRAQETADTLAREARTYLDVAAPVEPLETTSVKENWSKAKDSKVLETSR